MSLSASSSRCVFLIDYVIGNSLTTILISRNFLEPIIDSRIASEERFATDFLSDREQNIGLLMKISLNQDGTDHIIASIRSNEFFKIMEHSRKG